MSTESGDRREHLVRIANGAILSQNVRVLAGRQADYLYATIDSPTLAWGWTRPEVGPLWLAADSAVVPTCGRCMSKNSGARGLGGYGPLSGGGRLSASDVG